MEGDWDTVVHSTIFSVLNWLHANHVIAADNLAAQSGRASSTVALIYFALEYSIRIARRMGFSML